MAASERGSAQDVVRRFHRASSERDASGLLACLTEEVRWHAAGAHPVRIFGDGPGAWDIVEVLRLADAGIAGRWKCTSGQAELDALLLRGCAAAAGTGDPGEQRSGC